MNKAKAAIMISTVIEKTELLIGGFIVLIFGCMLLDYLISCEAVGAVIAALFGAPGVALICASRKRHRLICTFKKYEVVLSSDPTGSIANISAALGTPEDIVRKNLALMIKKRYFANAFIDPSLDRIILPGNASQAAQNQRGDSGCPAASVPNKAVPGMVDVTCQGCGAVNSIPIGTAGECEYCGSSIHG